MIILFLLLVLQIKFDYPSPMIDFLLSLTLILCVLSILFTVISSFFIKIKVIPEKETYFVGEDLKFRIEYEGTALNPSVDLIVKQSYQQRKESKNRVFRKIYANQNNEVVINDLKAGKAYIQVRYLVCKGYFGVFRFFKKTDKKYEFLIIPRPEEVNMNSLKKIILHGDGEITNFKGDDYTELYEVREFQEGDDLKYMHRMLTEKFGEYMIKVGTDTQRVIYIYGFEKCDDFDTAVKQLSQILYMYFDIVKEQELYFCIQNDKAWKLILNDGQIREFIDEVYSEYAIV